MSFLEGLIQAHSNPYAPADERRDAGSALFREFVSGLTRSDFIQADEVQQWLAEMHREQDTFTKAVTLQSFPREVGRSREPGRPESVIYAHELGVIGASTLNPWMEKPGNAAGFDFLAYMHEVLDIHQALVYTRQHQATPFFRPYDENDDNPLGYRWVRRDGEKLTTEDQKECRRLDRILQSCGTETDAVMRKWVKRRRTLKEFGASLVADTLTYDWCPTEIIHDNSRKFLGWRNLDPRLIRLAFEDGYLGDDRIVALQVRPEEQAAILGYEMDEIVCDVRNPRSSIWYGDYGRAELEAFVKAATAYMNSFTFNAANQDRNSLPRGFLTLYGRFDKRALNSFRGMWNDLVRGAANRWALPVLVSESKQEGGAAYTPVDTATSEMYLTKWMIFLVSIMCALYGMDPVELNMESFTSKTSSLSGKDTAEKLQSSHDRGFIPLMLFIFEWLNDNIVARLTKKYYLTAVGLFPGDEERKHERQKLSLTVDECRAIDGEDAHPDPDIGAAPINPSLMSIYSLKLQTKMQQDMLAQQGGGGGDQGDELPGGEQHLRGHYGDDGADGNGGNTLDEFPTPRGGPKQPLDEFPAPGKMAKSRLVVTIKELP